MAREFPCGELVGQAYGKQSSQISYCPKFVSRHNFYETSVLDTEVRPTSSVTDTGNSIFLLIRQHYLQR